MSDNQIARQPYMIHQRTWLQVGHAAHPGKVLLQPLGAIEQHGRHRPVDTDKLAAAVLCDPAAQSAPNELVVAPAIPAKCSST
jgi:creatinine amidohydrolase/Fe(II)-dependent formamide hydrolase-like protein